MQAWARPARGSGLAGTAAPHGLRILDPPSGAGMQGFNRPRESSGRTEPTLCSEVALPPARAQVSTPARAGTATQRCSPPLSSRVSTLLPSSGSRSRSGRPSLTSTVKKTRVCVVRWWRGFEVKQIYLQIPPCALGSCNTQDSYLKWCVFVSVKIMKVKCGQIGQSPHLLCGKKDPVRIWPLGQRTAGKKERFSLFPRNMGVTPDPAAIRMIRGILWFLFLKSSECF